MRWRNDIPLSWFLYFAAASFAIGLAGVLVRRNAIAVLMAIEIMLNAANVNLVAFWRYGPERPEAGPIAGHHPGHHGAHGRRGRGRRRHRLDLALLPPLACRRRGPLRQPGRLMAAEPARPARPITTHEPRTMPIDLSNLFRDVFFLAPEIVLTVWGLVVLLVDLGLARRLSPAARRRTIGWLSLAGRGDWRWLPPWSCASCRSWCERIPRTNDSVAQSRRPSSYFSDADPVIFFGTLAVTCRRVLQHPVRRCCWVWSSACR